MLRRFLRQVAAQQGGCHLKAGVDVIAALLPATGFAATRRFGPLTDAERDAWRDLWQTLQR